MNYYRFMGAEGEMWPTTPAHITAQVQGGKITGFTVISGGAGYTSTPIVTVPGFGQVPVDVEIAFSTDFTKNGSIERVMLK